MSFLLEIEIIIKIYCITKKLKSRMKRNKEAWDKIVDIM